MAKVKTVANFFTKAKIIYLKKYIQAFSLIPINVWVLM